MAIHHHHGFTGSFPCPWPWLQDLGLVATAADCGPGLCACGHGSSARPRALSAGDCANPHGSGAKRWCPWHQSEERVPVAAAVAPEGISECHCNCSWHQPWHHSVLRVAMAAEGSHRVSDNWPRTLTAAMGPGVVSKGTGTAEGCHGIQPLQWGSVSMATALESVHGHSPLQWPSAGWDDNPPSQLAQGTPGLVLVAPWAWHTLRRVKTKLSRASLERIIRGLDCTNLS